MSERLLQAAAKRGFAVPPPPHTPAVLGELIAAISTRPGREGRRMPREEAYLAGSRRLAIPTSCGGLAAWEWGPAGAPLVGFVHGWEGHGAQLGAFAAPLAAAGFRVLAFDAPGHGESPGDEAHVPLVARVLVELERQTGPFFALIGHSMGAAAAALSATIGTAPRGLVMLAPPQSQLERMLRVGARLQLSPEVQAAYAVAMERRLAMRLSEVDMLATARVAPCPLLIFHDPADPDTSYEASAQTVSQWRGARLVACPDRGHYRILATPEVVRQAVEFIGGLRRAGARGRVRP